MVVIKSLNPLQVTEASQENEAASASPALGIMSQLQLGPHPGHLVHHKCLMHPLKGQQRCELVRKKSHK